MEAMQLDEEAIFQVARRIADREARAAYLGQVCGVDAALRGRLERLIRVGEQEASFLAAPPCGATVDRPAEAERPGALIGPYKLLEPIGEGGMGIVFMAEQAHPVRRKVALKVIKPGMDSKQVVARFESERQALALMDHPNIARVFDAGATETGRPYFVMELVRGVPITEYCDREHLPVAGRLELFVLVCRAVQHAHQKGIIHRDLKPSNILVTLHDSVPVPKVIDFGIAKATGQNLTDKTLFTGFAQLVGTPLYMSPEQAEMSGLDVDTRSDIYSLGVVLYELLTGTTPFDGEMLRRAAFDEMRRIIREEEPPRPSTRLSSLGETLTAVSTNRAADSRRLNRTVRGELDWIVMKALEKDRNRRYETANDFAADVMRYLTDRPVEAYPPSAGYRLRKYACKHSRLLITVASFLLLVVLGGAFSAWKAVQATWAAKAEHLANEKAQQRLAQVERSNEILGSIFKDLDPATEGKDGKPLRVQLGERLDQAAQQLEGEAVGDALAVAKLQLTLGESQLGLGDAEKAIVLFTRAHATFDAEAGPEHPDTIACAKGLFRAYSGTVKLQKALPWFEGTLRLAEARLGRWHPATIAYMDTLACVYHYSDRLDQSIALFEETVKSRTAALGREHQDTLKSMNGLAIAYRSARRLQRAIPLFEETIRLQQATLGPAHRETLHSMHQLAWSYVMDQKLDRALQLFEEELKLCIATSGPQHPRTLGCMNDLGIAYGFARRHDEALRMKEETYRLRRATLGAEHPDTLGSMDNLASEYDDAGKADQSLALKEEALALAKAKWGPKHPTTLMLMQQLGRAYRYGGKPDRAVSQLDETLNLRRAALAVEDQTTVEVMHELGLAYQEIGKQDQALGMFESSLKLYKAVAVQGPDLLPAYIHNLASAYRLAGKPDRALSFRKEELDLARARYGPDNYETLIRMVELALEHQRNGELGPGLSLCEEALRVARDKLGPENPRTHQFMSSLAFYHQQSGRHDQALTLHEEQLRLAKAKWGPEDEHTYGRMDDVAGAYIAVRRFDDAARLCLEMLAIQRRKRPAGDRLLSFYLAGIGPKLAQAGHAVEAESLLRECLAIRQQVMPREWQTFETQSLLGDALRIQKKYTEAESLMLQGYEGLERRKSRIGELDRRPVAEAAGRLVRLYETTRQSQKAAAWRLKTESKPVPKK